MSDIIGPALPPGSSGGDQQDVQYAGPALPPGFIPATDSETQPGGSVIVGPALPPGFKPATDAGTSDSSQSSDSDNDEQPLPDGYIGPVIPSGVSLPKSDSDSESSEDDVIGPRPYTGDESDFSMLRAAELERRAQKMKDKLLNKDTEGPQQREEWMTILPSKKLKLGSNLSARKFRGGSGTITHDDDGSAWTETPADRERKLQERREGKAPKRKYDEKKAVSERDQMMKEMVEEYNTKKQRQESLLEMHEKKIGIKKDKKEKKKDKKKEKKKKEKEKKKKKEKEKEKPKNPERKPFDRDTDLKVNMFDKAMKNQYIKRAQGLGGKFGHGGQQFL